MYTKVAERVAQDQPSFRMARIDVSEHPASGDRSVINSDSILCVVKTILEVLSLTLLFEFNVVIGRYDIWHYPSFIIDGKEFHYAELFDGVNQEAGKK